MLIGHLGISQVITKIIQNLFQKMFLYWNKKEKVLLKWVECIIFLFQDEGSEGDTCARMQGNGKFNGKLVYDMSWCFAIQKEH